MSLRGAIPSFGPVCTLPGSVVNPQAWVGFLSKWRLINMYRLEKVCLQQLQTKWRLWCLSCRWRRRESRLVYLLQVWIELHAVADDATALSAAPQPCSAGGNSLLLWEVLCQWCRCRWWLTCNLLLSLRQHPCCFCDPLSSGSYGAESERHSIEPPLCHDLKTTILDSYQLQGLEYWRCFL